MKVCTSVTSYMRQTSGKVKITKKYGEKEKGVNFLPVGA